MSDTVSYQFFFAIGQGRATCGLDVNRFSVVLDYIFKNPRNLKSCAQFDGAQSLGAYQFFNTRKSACADRHCIGKIFQNLTQKGEIWGYEELRLRFGDIEFGVGRLNGVGQFFHLVRHAPRTFTNGGKQSGTIYFWVVHGADKSVFHGPPMQVSDKGHFTGFAHIVL